jgi:HAD superfamily hydrolase (TIGR01509 family)
MLEAVIFDMDGVIIDSEPINFAVEQEIFLDLGICLTEEEHQSYVGTTGEAMWASIKRNHGLSQSVEELHTLSRKHYLQAMRSIRNIEPIPGVVELIDDIRSHGLPTVVASSSSPENIDHVLNTLGMRHLFEAVIDGIQVQNSKPSPDIFLRAAASINKDPLQCLVIEDSQVGVTAAKKAGMSCIGYWNVSSGNQNLSNADVVVQTLTTLNYAKLVQIHHQVKNQSL